MAGAFTFSSYAEEHPGRFSATEARDWMIKNFEHEVFEGGVLPAYVEEAEADFEQALADMSGENDEEDEEGGEQGMGNTAT